MSQNEKSSCSSSNCKIWCYLYGLAHLLLLTCISMALWEITRALQAHADTLRTHLSLLIDAHWIWGLDES